MTKTEQRAFAAVSPNGEVPIRSIRSIQKTKEKAERFSRFWLTTEAAALASLPWRPTMSDDLIARLLSWREKLSDISNGYTGWLDHTEARHLVPLCKDAADHIAAQAEEIERLRIDLGHSRMCLNCGQTVDAKAVQRGDDLPECRGPDGLSACTFDATPQEAWEHWRKIAHEQRNEIKRLTKDRDEARAQTSAVAKVLHNVPPHNASLALKAEELINYNDRLEDERASRKAERDAAMGLLSRFIEWAETHTSNEPGIAEIKLALSALQSGGDEG